MAKAIEQIVDAYVRYSNRRAIDELKRHRQKILLDIRMRSRDYDWSLLTSTIEEELAVINAGLDRLQP